MPDDDEIPRGGDAIAIEIGWGEVLSSLGEGSSPLESLESELESSELESTGAARSRSRCFLPLLPPLRPCERRAAALFDDDDLDSGGERVGVGLVGEIEAPPFLRGDVS